jgi:hypothetical protein
MDEWAPYRMALLILMVASSIAIWASYKILWSVHWLNMVKFKNHGKRSEIIIGVNFSESDERDEVIYQPLAAPNLIGQMEDEFWSIEDGHQQLQNQSKSAESSSTLSSMEDDCLFLNGAGGNNQQHSLPSKIRSK